MRKRCSRKQLLAFTANLQVQLIGMKSCSGSHFLGRALREQGHEVRLMPAQYVKPYVQTKSLTPLKAEYIGADQLPSSFFRLQLCGGPYIPKISSAIPFLGSWADCVAIRIWIVPWFGANLLRDQSTDSQIH